MSEPILNEEEIKDLLKQPPSLKEIGHLWEGEAASYDLLQSANKVKEKILIADQIHQNITPSFEKSLIESCGEGVKTTFAGHETKSGAETLSEISAEKSLAFTWANEAGGQEGLFLMDRALFFRLYGKILGGSGAFEKKGQLTSLERTILDRLLFPLAELLEQAWKGSAGWKFRPKNLLVDQEGIASLGWTFDCLSAGFNIQADDVAGSFQILFPREILSTLGENGSVAEEIHAPTAAKDHQWMSAVYEAIRNMPVPISVNLGAVITPLRDVLQIQEGNEFVLLTPENGYVVSVRERPMFVASIGTMGENKAIRIIHHSTEATHVH